MESLLKPVNLSPETDRVLEEVRTGPASALYGAGPAEAEELFKKHLLSLIQGAGLPVLQVMHYQWFLRELARLWRTRTGRDLAFHLELCLRKWVGLGLESRTLQFLVCEAHSRLKAENLTTKTPSHQGSAPTIENRQSEIESPVAGDCPRAESQKTAKGGDMTELPGNSDRVPSPTLDTRHSALDNSSEDLPDALR